MKQLKIAAAVAALLGAMAAQAASLAKSDQAMLKQMAQANIAEIEAGKIALQKSQNNDVKAFAQQMIDDHTKGLQAVQAVAQNKGVTLPTEPDAQHKAMAKKLNKLSGDAFDRAYAQDAGVSDHKKVHAYVQKVQGDAKDADVKALAAKLEPTIAQHLSHVETLNASLEGASPRTAGQQTGTTTESTGASGAQGTTGAGHAASPDASASGKTPYRDQNKTKADRTSGNTDNPENPANKDVHPPVKY